MSDGPGLGYLFTPAVGGQSHLQNYVHGGGRNPDLLKVVFEILVVDRGVFNRTLK